MVSVRAATIADARAIAAVDVETWRTTYAGILPDQFLLGLSERQRAGSWSRFIGRRPGDTVVALDDRGQIIGYGSCGMQRDIDLPYAGEVFTLYVAPDFQGRNIGRQLLVTLFARLIRCGFYSSLIWVLRDNPARFFYERLGGQAVAMRRIEMGRGIKVDAVGYAWRDLAEAVQNRGQAKSRIA
jgi:ribosomal protein S18 acetylase RimI-like enzyme